MKIIENNSNVNETEKLSSKKRKALKKLNQSSDSSEPLKDVTLSQTKKGKKRGMNPETNDNQDQNNDNSMVENSPKKKKCKKSKQENGVESETVIASEVSPVVDTPNKKRKRNRRSKGQVKNEGMEVEASENEKSETPDSEAMEVEKEDNKEGNKLSKKNKKNKNAAKGQNQNNKPGLSDKNKRCVIVDKVKIFILKQGQNKFVFNICFEENERMAKFLNFYVKPECVKELNQLKTSLTAEGLKEDEVTRQLKFKEKIFNFELKIDIYGELINELEDKEEKSALKVYLDSLQDKTNKMIDGFSSNNKTEETPISDFEFKENDLMTCFDDTWILKKELSRVQKLSEEQKSKIIQKRADGSTDTELTPEEEIVYSKFMKILKKKETGRLKQMIKRNLHKQTKGKSNGTPTKNGAPESKVDVDESSSDDEEESKTGSCLEGGESDCPSDDKSESSSDLTCEKCNEDGHLAKDCPSFIKMKEAPTCYNCNESGHISKMCPKKANDSSKGRYFEKKTCSECGSEDHLRFYCPQVKGTSQNCFNCNEPGHMSRECPQKSRGQNCFNCNEPGHMSRECPQKSGGRSGAGGGNCFNCNEPGHMSRECPQKRSGGGGGGGGNCYNCNEPGHLSRDCPTKSKRCCDVCGSEDHLRRECPDKPSGGGNCFNCNEPGHMSRECPQKRSGGGGGNCFNCNKPGHMSRECPENQNRRDSGGFSRGGRGGGGRGGFGGRGGGGFGGRGGSGGRGGFGGRGGGRGRGGFGGRGGSGGRGGFGGRGGGSSFSSDGPKPAVVT